MKKEEQWTGYFNGYLAKASRHKIKPQILLDREWDDGRETAERCVFPYITEESIVLEIACGIGRVSRFVAPLCKHLYCTDILEDALNETRKSLSAFKNVKFYKTDGYSLQEFKENSFDCIYSFTAFFHFDFELIVHYFAEIKRILKPDGIGIIEFKKWINNKDVIQLLDKVQQAGGIERYEATLDKWRYVSEEMVRVLCDYHHLNILVPNVTRFTFSK